MIPELCIQVPSLRDELSEIVWEVEQGGAYTIIGGDNQPRVVLISVMEYERLTKALEEEQHD